MDSANLVKLVLMGLVAMCISAKLSRYPSNLFQAKGRIATLQEEGYFPSRYDSLDPISDDDNLESFSDSSNEFEDDYERERDTKDGRFEATPVNYWFVFSSLPNAALTSLIVLAALLSLLISVGIGLLFYFIILWTINSLKRKDQDLITSYLPHPSLPPPSYGTVRWPIRKAMVQSSIRFPVFEENQKIPNGSV